MNKFILISGYWVQMITPGNLPKEDTQCSYIVWNMGCSLAVRSVSYAQTVSTTNIRDKNSKSNKVVPCLKYNKGTCRRNNDHE